MSGHIRGVEQLRSAQRIANVYVAVADCENLILPVNISDLMNEAVFLALLEDFKRLLLGDIWPPFLVSTT
jgi:hypothetical protein